MTTSPKRFPLFFGSTVVLGCFLGMIGSTGAMLFSSLGVLFEPLSTEFGWSRGDISYGAAILPLGIIVGLLTTGPLIDKFGSRRVLLVSVSLSIVIVVTGPLYITSLSLFYTMLLIGAIVGGPTNTVGYARVVASWFDKRRGLFIGINACGLGLGFALVPLITNKAVELGGWQAGYYCLALIMILIVMPSLLFLVIDKPGDVGCKVDGEAGEVSDKDTAHADRSLSLREAAGTSAFWLLLYIVAAIAFALQGTLIHLVPLLLDRGIEPSTAALVASSIGFSMAGARLLVGFLLDHWFAPRLSIVVFSFATIGVLLVLFTNSLPLYFLAAILVGFGLGAEGDLMAYLVSRYYGMKNFAKIFSCIFSFYMIGTGAGPALFGQAHDSYGNYSMVLYISVALMVSAIILFLFLRLTIIFRKNWKRN